MGDCISPLGAGGLLARRARPVTEDDEDYVPVVRRSDRHPDAPPRRPLNAAELGAPPPPVDEEAVERTLPADLDQPLSAYDPDAILSAPREPLRPAPPQPMPIPPMREPEPEDRGAALAAAGSAGRVDRGPARPIGTRDGPA